jgi:hypothetical protein
MLAARIIDGKWCERGGVLERGMGVFWAGAKAVQGWGSVSPDRNEANLLFRAEPKTISWLGVRRVALAAME